MTLTLQDLVDRAELTDLVTRYATCVDAKDYPGVAGVFTDGASVSFAAAGGPEGTPGEIVEWLRQTLPIFPATQHLLANPVWTLDGDTATGRVMCFNPMAFDDDAVPGQRVMFYGLWYTLAARRTADGWRLTRLDQEVAFHHNRPF